MGCIWSKTAYSISTAYLLSPAELIVAENLTQSLEKAFPPLQPSVIILSPICQSLRGAHFSPEAERDLLT